MGRIGRGALLLLCGALALPGQDATEDILKRAIALHQVGDIANAIPAYESYLAKRPDSPLALSNLGAAYARVARYPDAIAQYRRALKLQPENPGVELNLALALYKTGQLGQAAATLEKVHRAAPTELQPIILLADCWLNLGENRKTISLLTPLATERPDDLAIAYMLGTALVRDDQIARGQAMIDRILRNGNSAETWLLMGTAKLRAKDYTAAQADFAKAVELNPQLPGAQTYYGLTLLLTGDPAGGMAAFRKALQLNPYDFEANLNLAALLRDDEKIAESRECLRRAMQVRPNDLLARHQSALIALHDDQLEDARRTLEAIVKEAPAFTDAHVTLAKVYYRLHRKADGDREREIVLKLNAEKQARGGQ